MTTQMTSRQRVKAALNYQPPDRIPCNESPWPDTLQLWRNQGMPADISLADYFDFDICTMALDCSPRYEQKIISQDSQWITYQDRWGYSATKQFGKASTIHFFDQKTPDKTAWQNSKHRWQLSTDPNESARIDSASYFGHFDPYPTWPQAKNIYNDIYAQNRYMLFEVYGPWEATWRHHGYENQLMTIALDPDWLKEMAQAHIDLIIAVMKKCLELNIKPDGLLIAEDLAATRGLLFSPESWRQIFKTMINQLGQFLKQNQIDFWMHCCGNAEALFEDLIDCGLQVMNPLQANTGLNVAELTQKYKNRLAFYGNISAPKMSGPIEELEQEIKSKVQNARNGGYIFHSDHSVPPQVDFQRYQWIIKKVRQYADK